MEYLTILIAVFLISSSLKLKYKIQLFNPVKEGVLLAIASLVIGMHACIYFDEVCVFLM